MAVHPSRSLAALFLIGCSAAPASDNSSGPDAGSVAPHGDAGGGGASDASSGGSGSGTGDGSAQRLTCTSSFGKGMSETFGRLDGLLVALVQPGTTSCSGDSDHMHLQIQMSGSTYDIAVDVDSTSGGSSDASFLSLGAPLLGGAWSEGWHTSTQLDYVSNLDVHSTQFATESKAQMTALLNTDLATVNHVSIFTTGYGDDGGHLVHREGSDQDGAIVIEPLSDSPEYLLIRFPEQSF